MRWCLLLLVCLLACGPSEEPYHLSVIGSKYGWRIVYDDGQVVPSAKELVLPPERRIHLILKSEDLLYTFRIKEWEINAMAVPELPELIEFETPRRGEVVMMGDQMCGYSHDGLILPVRLR